jgi:hypothetical protein
VLDPLQQSGTRAGDTSGAEYQCSFDVKVAIYFRNDFGGMMSYVNWDEWIPYEVEYSCQKNYI